MSSSVPVQQVGVVVCYPIPQQMCTGTSTFSRVHPIALGTVQIMIGLMVFLLGVVAAASGMYPTVISGFFVWGAGFYITAGSLTVASGKSSNRCLMNTALAFNVIATVAAGVATILYAIEAAVMFYCSNYVERYDSYDGSNRPIRVYDYQCNMYKTHMQGVRGVLAVFHFLEFIITIVVSGFACKSTCDCGNQQQPIYIIPGNAPMALQAQATSSAPATLVQLPPQDMPTYPAAYAPMAHSPPQSFPGLTDPPPISRQMKRLLKPHDAMMVYEKIN